MESLVGGVRATAKCPITEPPAYSLTRYWGRSMKLINLVGRRFTRLVVTEQGEARTHPGAGVSHHWICVCDCGTVKSVSGRALRSGLTQSCGCLNKELARSRATTHGGTGTAEYRAWRHMIGRCTDKNDKAFKDYGGRGIEVCDVWRKSFSAFLNHVGVRPSAGHSIDRINNDGNYEPGNVRWATAEIQANNKRNPNGKTHCIVGHEFTPGNTYTQASTGYRQCKACRDSRENNRVRRR